MDSNKLLHHKLIEGKKVIGSFVLSHDPEIIRVAHTAGLHFIMLDYEHGTISQELIKNFIDVAEGLDISIFVRCTIDHIPFLGPLIDHGLDGVIVAGATSLKDVQRIIATVKFPPQGKRGLNPFVPGAKYGTMNGNLFMERENERTSIWILAENEKLLQGIEEISSLDGVAGIFFGPYDLSVDIGIPGEVDHPKVMRFIQDAIKVIQRNERSIGIFTKNGDGIKKWDPMGVSLFAVGFDWHLLVEAWSKIVKEYQG